MGNNIQARGGTHICAWSFCDRCGRQYRLNVMAMQNGSLLCLEDCYDNPDSFIREAEIAQVLQEIGTEMQNMTAVKRAEGSGQNLWDDF